MQEIIDHADEIAAAFENFEPDPEDHRPAAPLRHATDAIRARAEAERAVAAAVKEMREASYSWAAIGSILGTSAEAARQRYGGEKEQQQAPKRSTTGQISGRKTTKTGAASTASPRPTRRTSVANAAAKRMPAKAARAAAAKPAAAASKRASASA